MSIYTKLHYRALTDLVEVMSILSTLAIGVDLYWCISDSIEQGHPLRLMPVLLFLSIALIGMSIAIVKYHRKLIGQFCKEMRISKCIKRNQCSKEK